MSKRSLNGPLCAYPRLTLSNVLKLQGPRRGWKRSIKSSEFQSVYGALRRSSRKCSFEMKIKTHMLPNFTNSGTSGGALGVIRYIHRKTLQYLSQRTNLRQQPSCLEQRPGWIVETTICFSGFRWVDLRELVCVWISRAPTVRQIETCDREHRSFTNAAFITTVYHYYYKHYPIYHYHMHISHYNDVVMSTMASRITSLTIVYSTV